MTRYDLLFTNILHNLQNGGLTTSVSLGLKYSNKGISGGLVKFGVLFCGDPHSWDPTR